MIESFIGKLCNGHINPYYWVHDHPLLHRNNGSLETARVKIRIIHWFKNSCSKFQKAFVILFMVQKSGDHRLRERCLSHDLQVSVHPMQVVVWDF